MPPLLNDPFCWVLYAIEKTYHYISYQKDRLRRRLQRVRNAIHPPPSPRLGPWKDFAWEPYEPILPRPRRLSTCSSQKPNAHTTVSSQPQSLFLSRLPIEVRSMILSLAIGRHWLHIVDGRMVMYQSTTGSLQTLYSATRARHLFHIACIDPVGNFHWCRDPTLPHKVTHALQFDLAPIRLLELLLVCRKL